MKHWLVIATVLLGFVRGFGQSVPLPVAPIVVLPPNTNTYGLPLQWDASTNMDSADGYRVYWQWPGTNAWNQIVSHTNVFGGPTNTTCIVRLPYSNGPPFIWATAVGSGVESEWSNIITKTNYQTRWAQDSTNAHGPWTEIAGSRSTVITTNSALFYEVKATPIFDNWHTVP